MNVTLPEKEKINKKTIIIYVFALIVCVIAISIVVGVQMLGNDVVDEFLGIRKLTKRSEEEELELKSNFDNIIDNNLEIQGEISTKKLEQNKEIVYTVYEKEEKQEQNEVNVNLPYININDEEAKKFNYEIIRAFAQKAEDVLKDTNKNVVYTVKYKAYVEENILSVIIYSNLKQDTSAQRVIIETFNYNLQENKKIELKDAINLYDLSEYEVQNKIDQDIKEEKRKAEELKNLGYEVFTRNKGEEYYKVEKVKQFFIYNGNIYIIFAYGNDDLTSQKDIVII